MTSARRTGVGESVTTYGSVGLGRDYTVLQTWETATQIDCVATVTSPVLECYDDAVFSDSIVLAGATTNASYFRIIRPAGVRGEASWQGHDGTPNTGVRFAGAMSGIRRFNITESNAQIQDIVAQSSITGTGVLTIFQATTGSSIHLIGCIAHDGTSTSGGCVGFDINNVTGAILIDCIAINNQSIGFRFVTGGSFSAYNCSSLNNSEEGFRVYTGTLVSKNCLSSGNTTADFSGPFAAASTNNASSDATAPGTSPRINQTFTFVDALNDDYHLDPTDLGARGFGADLSADATFPFDDDIDGDLIATWSIGADAQAAEAAAPGGSGMGRGFLMRRRRR